MAPITVYGDVDARAVEQLCAAPRRATPCAASCAPTATSATRSPIGGAVAYPDHISPSGVGYDIACGNKAVPDRT